MIRVSLIRSNIQLGMQQLWCILQEPPHKPTRVTGTDQAFESELCFPYRSCIFLLLHIPVNGVLAIPF